MAHPEHYQIQAVFVPPTRTLPRTEAIDSYAPPPPTRLLLAKLAGVSHLEFSVAAREAAFSALRPVLASSPSTGAPLEPAPCGPQEERCPAEGEMVLVGPTTAELR
jgi:hypothetical protein